MEVLQVQCNVHDVVMQLYGKNEMTAGKPSVHSLAAEFLTLPWYLVQVILTLS